jgi:acyl phosphate:glycerol-3-phosphate acyltransferase
VVLALALSIAYLCGSFPTGVILSRWFAGDDVRAHGSGNPSAANVVRTYGFKLGLAVGVLDIIKGIAGVLIGRWLGVNATGLALAAVAAVAGHDYSVFLRFRGGKGVATTLGAGLGLAFAATALAMIFWVAVMLTSRYSSLASLTSLAALPVLIAVTGGPPAFVVCTVALFVLALVKHRENIGRLWNGTERKFRSLTPANGA